MGSKILPCRIIFITFAQRANELSEPKTLPPHLISQVGHINRTVHLEDMWVAHHLTIPSFSGDVDTGFSIIPRPVSQVGAVSANRYGLAPTVGATIVGTVPIAKKHVVATIRKKNIRAGPGASSSSMRLSIRSRSSLCHAKTSSETAQRCLAGSVCSSSYHRPAI